MKLPAVIFSLAAVAFVLIGNPAAYVAAAVYGLAAFDCWRA